MSELKFLNTYAAELEHKKNLPVSAKELAYRTAFENLLTGLFPRENKYDVVHEPTDSPFGNPDFALLKNRVPILYIEAKDVAKNIDKLEGREIKQLENYLSYPSLIYSNYYSFKFYRSGVEYGETISIAEIDNNGNLIFLTENYQKLIDEIKAFVELPVITVKSATQLSQIMGKTAQRIRRNVLKYLEHTDEEKNQELLKQFKTFKKLLIADLTKEQFADMYTQTLVYGLFVARYNDESLDTFTRREAQELVPKSNPFLQKFFQHIAGNDFDERLEIVVNEFSEVLSRSDVKQLMHDYFKGKNLWGADVNGPDPVIHFYEDFLREYDPKQRIDLGVFYTPPAVVSFIVRSVDQILQKKFNEVDGLASTSQIDHKIRIQGEDLRTRDEGKYETKKVPRVQILDPAVGTGTFLNEVIHQVYNKKKDSGWPTYVREHLINRLYGFELMMASYTIAHLKLGMTLAETGVNNLDDRLQVYLTNTLEAPKTFEDTSTLFGVIDALTTEAREASKIKRDHPIMVVIGNPPYSGESSNAFYKGNDVYKFEPGGEQKLQERNSKWLNDDYVKFIRFAEDQISKTGNGIVGMITGHGYLDNPTFRGMRWHLQKTFDEVYVLDLHGNSNKKEMSPDGSSDVNVFDIKTGVAILLAVKTGKKKEGDLGKVFHADLYGTRSYKYSELNDNDWQSIKWGRVYPEKTPFQFYAPFASELWEDYESAIKLNDLLPINSVGIVTSRDELVIDSNKKVLEKKIKDFVQSESIDQAKDIWSKENKSWKIKDVINQSVEEKSFYQVAYRPFDTRYIYYHSSFIERSRDEIMQNFLRGKNVGLMVTRQVKTNSFYHALVHQNISESSLVSNKTSEIGYDFPLFLYEERGDGTLERMVNLDGELVGEIEGKLGMKLDKLDDQSKPYDISYYSDDLDSDVFSPVDLLDYIYAVLHSPSYREKYQEFLKIDFPRVPFDVDKKIFWQLVAKGSQLRHLHLLENIMDTDLQIRFPNVERSDNLIETKFVKSDPGFKKSKETDSVGRVYINDQQYFDNVPQVAWEFYIGGYQPAQKWLKDRIGRNLSYDDIQHYRKIIHALENTDRIMREIDTIKSDW